MTDSPIERLIDASSLGTPEAARLRSTTSDETARRIVERSEQIAAEPEWEAHAQSIPCTPYYCPTSGEVECCPEHSGFDVCCDRTDLHQPVTTRD